MRAGLLLAMLAGILATGALAQDAPRTVEDIINDAWESHLQRVADGVYFADGAEDHSEMRPHKCVHDEMMKEPVRRGRFKEMKAKRDAKISQATGSRAARQSGTFGPIRFYSDTRIIENGATDSYTCTQANVAVESYQTTGASVTCRSGELWSQSVRDYLLLTIIPAVTATFSTILNVEQLAASGITPTKNDLCISIADSYAGHNASNVDYYMFFSARATTDANTIATADSCASLINGRPYIGYVNFNPGSYQSKPSDIFKFKQALRIGMHEFTHALGFSSGLFDSYLNSAGVRYPAAAFHKDGAMYTGVGTPGVLSWARSYFACPTLNFMPLEDDGGSGTAGSHWEQVAVFDEYMVGIATQFFPISNLTLNLLGDTGWYKPDFSKAEDLSWGWSKGCQFLDNACTEPAWNAQGPNDAYDCSGSGSGCTADRLAIGPCTQPFASTLVTMPNCDFYTSQSGTYCQANGTQADGVLEDFYCDQCRCLSVGNAATSKSAGCFQVRCDGAQLQVQHKNDWHDCPADGSAGSVKVGSSVPGISTTIYCPAAIEICRQVSIDSNRIVTYAKKTGWRWLFTNNSLLFWGIVAAILVVGMIALCICMCMLQSICGCLCGSSNKGHKNRALMMQRR